MQIARFKALVLLGCGALAACSGQSEDAAAPGTGGGTPPASTPLFTPSPTLANEPQTLSFLAIEDRLNDFYNTSFPGVPSGSAVYDFDGNAVIQIAAPGSVNLVGDATLRIDFSGGTDITGSLFDFVGDDGGVVGGYAGTVTLSNGTVGAGVPNDIDFDYDGTLTGQGNVIALDGTASGKLKATPIRGLIATSDPGDLVDINGSITAVSVGIVAEN